MTGDGLNYATGGKVSIYWDQYSIILCKGRGIWYHFSEAFSKWILVAILCERLFALICVFRAKQWQSKKNAFILVLIVIAIALFFSWPTLLVYQIYISPNYIVGRGCMPIIDNSIRGWLFVLLSNSGYTLYPTLVMLLFTCLLACKLIAISHKRKQLSSEIRPHDHHHSQKEINAAITIFLISLVDVFIYIPACFFGSFYILSDVFDISNPVILLTLLRFFLSMTIVVRLWNIYLYMIRMPAFRHTLFSLCCKNNNKLLTPYLLHLLHSNESHHSNL